jgi:hypothetical protein
MTGIYWDEREAQLLDYSTSGRAGRGTTIEIKLRVTDSYALSHILRSLDEQLAAQRAKAAREEPAPSTSLLPVNGARMTPQERRALARGQAPLLIGYREK